MNKIIINSTKRSMRYEARLRNDSEARCAVRRRTKDKIYFVYFLRSINHSQKTYIGYTTNIEQRLETYNSGGSVYTKDHRPWNLVTYIAFGSFIFHLRRK